MEQNYRFVYQENQFWGKCVPCTPEVFNHAVDSPEVDFKIGMRQAIEGVIAEGKPLDSFTLQKDFARFCTKKQSEKYFADLPLENKLLQWATHLKNWLPCFIFGVSAFMGQYRRLAEIEQLSGLFMFDADKLPCDPFEIYKRTQVESFHWQVRLAHKTSSGHGLRLVCEARPELGNIADNQICLAKDLGLMGMIGSTGKPVVDDSCIDATRISYCPRREDIYFVDEEHLFNI
ncbi:MAG: hypothetical protein IKW91_07030 [Bacteroidaceae bacterium]|nr:hypothetical protein [Bacteroidaceae bacterium]